MGRPQMYNNLTTTTITIETETKNQAKAMGINISDVARQALESMIGDPNKKGIFFKFNKIPRFEQDKVRRFVKEDQDRAGFWAGWLNKKYGTELVESDILEWIST